MTVEAAWGASCATALFLRPEYFRKVVLINYLGLHTGMGNTAFSQTCQAHAS